MLWYGILEFNVPLDTVGVISETGTIHVNEFVCYKTTFDSDEFCSLYLYKIYVNVFTAYSFSALTLLAGCDKRRIISLNNLTPASNP